MSNAGWLSFLEGLAAGLVALIVLTTALLKWSRRFGRWAWRHLVTAVADELLVRLDTIAEQQKKVLEKVTPNGGDDTTSVATRVVQLEQAVAELTRKLNGSKH